MRDATSFIFDKDWKFVGNFDLMYQEIEDPWNIGDATDIEYDIILYFIKKYCHNNSSILDIGCGKGAFTYRLKRDFDGSSIDGVDISDTCIAKAKEKNPTCTFEVIDIKNYKSVTKQYDVIIMSQILWYILDNLEDVLNHLIQNCLNHNGHLIISLAMYQPNNQYYGNDKISSVDDIPKYIKLPLLHTIETDRSANHNVVMIFKKL